MGNRKKASMPLQATVKEDDKAHEERTSQGLVTQLLLHLHPVNGTQGMKKSGDARGGPVERNSKGVSGGKRGPGREGRRWSPLALSPKSISAIQVDVFVGEPFHSHRNSRKRVGARAGSVAFESASKSSCRLSRQARNEMIRPGTLASMSDSLTMTSFLLSTVESVLMLVDDSSLMLRSEVCGRSRGTKEQSNKTQKWDSAVASTYSSGHEL